MADFTGMTVTVRLKHQNMELHGKVVEVVAGHALTLQNVFVPATGAHYDHWTLQGSAIADLQVLQPTHDPSPASAPSANVPQSASPRQPQQQQRPQPQPQPRLHYNVPPPRQPPPQSNPASEQQSQRQSSDFVDPAILSYGKSPAPRKVAEMPAEAPATPVKAMLAKAAESLPINSSPFIGKAASKSTGTRKASTVREPGHQQASVAQQPIGGFPPPPQVQYEAFDGAQEAVARDNGTKKKGRSQRQKKANAAAHNPPPVMNSEVSRNGNDMNGSVRRGKGWRQTPLLQPSPQQSYGMDNSDTGKATSKKKTRRQKELADELRQDGWATEDANNIQELEDFDFEANHKLFNKKHVFDELRQGDTTAEEELLVSHNRLPRPGTYGGKNLHPTENVLSPPLQPKHGSGEFDSTSDADTELNLDGVARSASKHSGSRVPLRKAPSRQNSAIVDGKPVPHPLTTSITSEHAASRSRTSLASRSGRSGRSVGTSPRNGRTQSPYSIVSATRVSAPTLPTSQPREPHLAVRPHLTPCPVLLPTALETLEQETTARYGLTADAITESAARSIAETAFSLFDHATHTSSTRGLSQPSPAVIVILAGNHATGARALAAARHLVPRSARLILVEALPPHHSSLHPQVRAQQSMLKRLVKAGLPLTRGPWRTAQAQIKTLPAPPAVIVDALLAGQTWESLAQSAEPKAVVQQVEAREMIEWANRSRAPVLSVHCPSGVSGVDGAATVVEGEPVAVRPERLLCLGVPISGVDEGLKAGEGWEVGVADVGLEVALARGEGVGFGGKWVVELERCGQV